MTHRLLVSLSIILVLGCTPQGEKTDTAVTSTPAGEIVTSGDYTLNLPLGLRAAAAYIPEDNPLSQAKIDLGRKLYFDARLSRDGTVSCASCHDPDRGFSDGRSVSAGINGQLGGRNAPTVMNRLFSKEQFWDGRSPDLEDQALGQIQNPIEMGHILPDMLETLRAVPAYAPAFEAAFNTPDITERRVARAIASYERTVLAGNAPFDRYQAGDESAMSESAVRGMEIFNGPQKGNCVTCHAGFNFTDESYHNIGAGMRKQIPDLGRFGVSKNKKDKGAFKTPTLRNLTMSAPYMHDGSEASLESIVDFYNRGGTPNQWLSREIRPLNLTVQEKADLVAFLKALTGDLEGRTRPTLPQ